MDIVFILTIFPHQCVSRIYHSKKHAVSIFFLIYSSGKRSTFDLVLHNSYLLWDYDMCTRYTEMNKQTNHQGELQLYDINYFLHKERKERKNIEWKVQERFSGRGGLWCSPWQKDAFFIGQSVRGNFVRHFNKETALKARSGSEKTLVSFLELRCFLK